MRPVVIVGGGIGGLVTALSLHECGIEAIVFESVPEIRALGVGINLLPHAVRELDALGLLDDLRAHGVAPDTLTYLTRGGREIWSEARGLAAGYRWPQISIHRGELQRILLDAVHARLGPDAVRTGHHLIATRSVVSPGGRIEGVVAEFRTHATDESGVAAGGGARVLSVTADLLVAADGIHSTVRALAHPTEGPPIWNGALLWRGTVDHPPLLDGRTMVWAGHPDQKFVAYPILDLPDGRQRINFIAEYRTAERVLPEREDWNREGDLDDVLPRFAEWVFDWCDIPALLRAAPATFVFPMVDRDPLSRWTEGRVTLLGDAAHPMYPIGSNGASQAILDARTLAGCLRACGSEGDGIDRALLHYEDRRRPATAAIVEANRSLGPELPMQIVEQRVPEGFGADDPRDISEVISRREIEEATEQYRRTAGFALAALASGESLLDQTVRQIATVGSCDVQ